MPELLFEVGKPCPIPVGKQEGSRLEMQKHGLALVMNYPELTVEERVAFDKGFSRYSFTTIQQWGVLLIFVIFKFAFPMRYVETNFDASLLPAETWDGFTGLWEGRTKNSMMTLLVDREIIKAIRMSGLRPDMLNSLKEAGAMQRSLKYTPLEYNDALKAVYSRFSMKQLYERGTTYPHRPVEGRGWE